MKGYKKNSVITEECKKNRNAGFTLVELLIAMLMTLIIVSSVGQFMATTSRTYQILDNQVNLQVEAQCTINMIADMVLEGNNVVFDSTNKMLRIYKNLGSTDSSGTLLDYRTAEQNIIWFDESSENMYLFICKNGTDYDNAVYAHNDGKLMAEGIDDFNVTCPTVSDLSMGLTKTRDLAQQHCLTVTVKLKTKAVYDSSNDDDFTYEAVDNIYPRNEIVEL
ncbi:MAG: prepilin-type N-terminal cleavage/methylation domain-containing protein [Clostridiales bacterium]|nr:prepilin-type N-terminal cleavage/methylation domain-containing protein [Clostridiales bacterium]